MTQPISFGFSSITAQTKVGAQRRLAMSRERRLIVAAALAGRPQAVIAKLVGVSQPHVSRTLAAVKRANNGTLRAEPEAILDFVDRREVGEIDTLTMMHVLSALSYTDGVVPEIGGIATDAYERGGWDDIEYAYQQDRLTFEEYSRLFRIHRARQ